jgi:hypothetical protein
MPLRLPLKANERVILGGPALVRHLAPEAGSVAPSDRPGVQAIAGRLAARDISQAFQRARSLLRHERRLLSHVH